MTDGSALRVGMEAYMGGQQGDVHREQFGSPGSLNRFRNGVHIRHAANKSSIALQESLGAGG